MTFLYSSPTGILTKGFTIAVLLCQFGSGSQNPPKLVHKHYILMDVSDVRHAVSDKNVKKDR